MISFSSCKWRRHTHLLTLIFFWTNSIFGQTYFDTSLDAYPSVSIAAPGDTVSFFIRLNNEGQSNNTGLSVKCNVPTGLDFLLSNAPLGTSFDPSNGIWQIDAALNGSTAFLEQIGRAHV